MFIYGGERWELCATGCDSKRFILGDIQYMYECCFCVRLPCWVGVCECRPDVQFVHICNKVFYVALERYTITFP